MSHIKNPTNIWQSLLICLIIIVVFISTIIVTNLLKLDQGISLLLSGVISFSIIGVILKKYYYYQPKIQLPSIKSFISIILLAVFLKFILFIPLTYFELSLGLFKPSLSSINLYSFILLIIITPIAEEFIFRDFILKRLMNSKNVIYSILASSLIFSLTHLKIQILFETFILGIILGYIYYKSKNIILCIVFHFIFNLISSYMVIYYNEVELSNVKSLFQIYNQYTFIIFLLGAIVIPIFFLKINKSN